MNKEYLKIKAGFILRGTSLAGWCKAHGTDPSNARKALLGIWKGPKGQEVRRRLLKESGADRP